MPLDPGSAVLGFIGTGVMGGPMALNLLRAGSRLLVHSRTAGRARALLEAGAEWRATPADVAAESDVVFTVLGSPADVAEVYVGADGVLESARAGTYLVDMTSSTPELARRIAEAARARGLHALDAPVSGDAAGARESRLAIMVGGEEADFASVRPLLQRLGTPVLHGGPGAGQHARLCDQIAGASGMIGVCEALAYARRAGLDPWRVLESMEQGSAAGRLLAQQGPRMLRGDYEPGLRVAHFLEDLGSALQIAEELDLDLPGVELARMLYQEVAEMGLGERGTQALFAIWDDDGGAGPPELVQLR